MRSIRVAEGHGYEVVHGIIDSLYVKKKDVNEQDAQNLADAIYEETQLPIDVKHVYLFITFLNITVGIGYICSTLAIAISFAFSCR